MLLFSEKEQIQLNPSYQRMGDVWTTEKKQLLIDSILNDYDLPKIYFYGLNPDKQIETGFNYSVVDGRQRLEAIWGFIEGRFRLANDFEYQRDTKIKLAGLSYDDIAQTYPKIKIQFDSFILPVIKIETDDEELIEDMFSRLNEAVPLNAAEKRNAFGGRMVEKIRDISNHALFVEKCAFSNRRFQHREVAARFLLIETNLVNNNKLIDTKKVYLDGMVKTYAKGKDTEVENFSNAVLVVLDEMNKTFSQNDPLLRSQGNMSVYYLLFRKAIELNEVNKINRRTFLDFQELISENRVLAVEDYEKASFELLEYERLTQQGTNDASNIKERFSVLASFIGLSNVEL